MLVFSAIAPHPPIIIPTVGKENLAQLNATVEAMEKLEEKLFNCQPEVIIIISPHGPLLADAFTVNVNTDYLGNLEDFGDFTTQLNFKNDLDLVSQIKNCALSVSLTTFPKLDHGVMVPLYYLTKRLANIKIVPINYSLMDYQSHFKFGQELKKIINKSKKRIAVIASGDLSHSLTASAPAGFTERAAEFDETLIKLLINKDTDGIMNLPLDLIDQGNECGLRSIIILLGILKDQDYQPDKLSYEGPFGVGYLVMDFKL
ncbi:MAG: AmmeMemoRadiSam system protein B [bacterium]